MDKIKFFKVQESEAGMRLDRWFKRQFPDISHNLLEKALRKGEIRVDKKRVKSNSRLEAGQEVKVPVQALESRLDAAKESGFNKDPINKKPKYSDKDVANLKANIIFQNAEILVIDKPAGLAVQGGTGIKVSVDDMLDALKFKASTRPKLVHRLDKETSGILLIARTDLAATKLTEIFRLKQTKKTYLAIVKSVPKPMEGVIRNKIGKADVGQGKEKVQLNDLGKEAITEYKVLDSIDGQYSLVELNPITGRTHQLRVHMQQLGTPIIGDGKYGGKEVILAELPRKLQLHAYKLSINLNGQLLHFKAPIPLHMKQAMQELGL